MSDVDDVKSGTTVASVISDIDGLPVSVDNNPAHFSGLIFAIGDWAQRTGNFLPLLTDGVVVSGSKTIVDSVSAVPFLRGMVTGARVYTPTDPCPPTAARIAAHNASARAAGTPTITGITAMPTGVTDISVNSFAVTKEDITLGNLIARCFEDADYANRLRAASGMGARAMLVELAYRAAGATPAEISLVCSLSRLST